MKSVFSKLFLGLLFSSMLTLIAISLILTLAIRTSISSWNQGKREDLETVLIPLISKSYRLNGELSENGLEEALAPYLTDSLYVHVFDSSKEPVFIFSGGRKSPPDSQTRLPGGGLLVSPLPVEIREGDDIVAYLVSDTVDFLADRANRDFLNTMIRAVSAGICLTFVLSLIIAGYISSGFSRQTRYLVKGIHSLGRGGRDVAFPEMGILELDQIGRSALNLQLQLAKEEQLRRQWMQDIAHDLKTPLTAVISQFEAMVDGALQINPERVRGLLSEVRRMEALVLNLQELSRYESPEMKIRKKKLQSLLFLEEMEDRFSFLAGQKGLSLKFTGESFFFEADEALMQRCLSNIIQNALQYTEAGGLVDISLKKAAEITVFEVRNTGHIPERDLLRIFDRLYRGSRSREGHGSGLGLSIAQAIARIHGGTIGAENAGESVLFTVKIGFDENSEEN